MDRHITSYLPYKDSTAVRNCLIAVVTSDIDLERFTTGGRYRIPCRSLGRSLGREGLEDCRYLAIYQTSSVTSGMPSAIEHWGRITRREELPRCEILPEEPDHPAAADPYMLLTVESVQRLESPITCSRPRRITFMRTTLERLLHASDMNDLVIGSRAEELLWNRIREMDVERETTLSMGKAVIDVDFAVFAEGKALGVICSEQEPGGRTAGEEGGVWGILRFSPRVVEAEFDRCAARIMDLVRLMRGN